MIDHTKAESLARRWAEEFASESSGRGMLARAYLDARRPSVPSDVEVCGCEQSQALQRRLWEWMHWAAGLLSERGVVPPEAGEVGEWARAELAKYVRDAASVDARLGSWLVAHPRCHHDTGYTDGPDGFWQCDLDSDYGATRYFWGTGTTREEAITAALNAAEAEKGGA